MTANYDINNIYDFLGKFGLDRAFIKSTILPSWWDDEIAKTKVGYLQAASLIAKCLGAELASLLEVSDKLPLKKQQNIKFKTARNVSSDTSIWPQIVASKLSEILEEIFPVCSTINKITPLALRSIFLNNYPQINLDTLLEFLWAMGIPVIYISKFPSSQSKMDGMLIDNHNRPIITISKNRQQDAWFLFIIAHELGHLLKGHTSITNSVIWDSAIQLQDGDVEEQEANDAALELLTGSSKPDFITRTITNPFQLANEARRIASKAKVNPGTVVLDYAYKNNDYQLSEQALGIINPAADAVSLIKSKMQKYLNLDELSEESYDFFINLTSISSSGE